MKRIRSILVATDFSTLSEAAAAWAAALARLDGAELHLVHAIRFPLVATPYEVSVPKAVHEGVRKAAETRLEQARQALEGRGAPTVTAEISDSTDPVHAIVVAIEAHAADLVAMGTHGYSGLKHAFLGSVAERTLRSVDRPVLVVKDAPAEAEEPISRILLPVDFSAHADRAVTAAAELAARLGASVEVLHAFGLPRDYVPYAISFGADYEREIRERVDQGLERVRSRLDASKVPARVHARRGEPSQMIARTAEETKCQLIIMATRGNSGLAHVLLGSVAERTLRTAPCPVLVIPSVESPEKA